MQLHVNMKRIYNGSWITALNIDFIAADMTVKSEKSGFNKSFRNFTATSTEGKIGPAESLLMMMSQGSGQRQQERRWGDTAASTTGCTASSLYQSEKETIRSSGWHTLWKRHWSYGVTGILTAILQDVEHHFQGWSFSWHYSMKQLERRNK